VSHPDPSIFEQIDDAAEARAVGIKGDDVIILRVHHGARQFEA